MTCDKCSSLVRKMRLENGPFESLARKFAPRVVLIFKCNGW